MLLTRSAGPSTRCARPGSSPPGFEPLLGVPGWQSTKYSPISDCGRASQHASLRRAPKPVSLISKSTSARLVFRSSAQPVTLPARTPATLKSAPSIRPNALSSSTLYFAPLVLRAGAARPATAAAPATSRGRWRAGDAPHFPGEHLARVAVVVGVGFHGFEPSSAWCSAPPGQRLRWPLAAAAGRPRRAAPAAPAELAARQREGVDVDADAPGAAERVVDARVAEVVEPAGEVDGVGPEVRRVRRGLLSASADAGKRARGAPCRWLDGADGDVAQRRWALRQLDQVVVGAGLPEQLD